MQEIARIRLQLEWYSEHRGQAEINIDFTADSPEPPSALQTLVRDFGLSNFERDLLVLCAGAELDDQFASICASISGDPGTLQPTFGLALAALPDPDWNALLPVSPLRHRRMIELDSGPTLTSCPIRLDERILHQLMGVGYLDERLQGLIRPVTLPESLPGSYRALAETIVDGWKGSQDSSRDPWPLVHLSGDATGGKQALAAVACSVVGLKLHVIRAADIPELPADRDALARLWDREAVLSRSGLLLDSAAAAGPASHAMSQDFMDRLHCFMLYTGAEAVRSREHRVLRIEVNRPEQPEQRAMWQSAFGTAGAELNGHLDAVTAQFSLDSEQIRTVADALQSDSAAETPLANRLWESCRNELRRPLDRLAARIPATAAWEDLVLPEAAKQTLNSITSHVRRRDTVYNKWGFGCRECARARWRMRGLGVTALFAGPSGTGKTLAAEVLAAELNLDLYRIDLSQMVSKYIGETEKNLQSVFDSAEGCGAILLFDEADALFGKRSEVKDSHDRYANIEVSYLLQRMEAYTGLAILTTNMRTALDSAFLRRIRFVVNFPFPDAAHRQKIWQRIFPVDLPCENLDMEKLCRLSVSGGSIRNIAITAAFLAADAGEPVRMTHLRRSAESECQKLEKPVSSAELGGWI